MEKKYPKVVVGCFIVNDQKEILLVRSYKWPDLWVVMGGHIEWGESISEANKREIKEELGLDAQFVRVIEPAEFIFDPHFHAEKHFIALQCECHVIGAPIPAIDHDEIQEARWFPLVEAAKLPDLLEITHQSIIHMLGN